MKDIYQSNDISVVVDNNVLIDLFELGCINLLFETFSKIVIPQLIYEEEIADEVKEEVNKYYFTMGKIYSEIGLETYGILSNDVQFKRLSRHDKFAIAIAKENLYYCNSNDKPVRKACEIVGVKYTGTLGVLGRAYHKKLISKEQLENFLELIVSDKTSIFIDVKTVERFKKEIFS